MAQWRIGMLRGEFIFAARLIASDAFQILRCQRLAQREAERALDRLCIRLQGQGPDQRENQRNNVLHYGSFDHYSAPSISHRQGNDAMRGWRTSTALPDQMFLVVTTERLDGIFTPRRLPTARRRLLIDQTHRPAGAGIAGRDA